MIGQSVGGYRIIAKLGEGGMGVVYRAEHRRISRAAAIKVLRSDLAGNTEMLERFFNEARATSMIRHPGIVEIYDCDVLPRGDAFIVMELLAGETLAAGLSRGPLGAARAIAVARETADALAAAHARGIVHRDLKPDNIFLVSAPGVAAETIKIVDFGIAKLTDSALMGGQRMTNTGRMLGTPTYMSPEQCRGARDVDARTDIYALGCILFEMVCGRPPFSGGGFGQLVASHISLPPPRLIAMEPGAGLELDALVARMLAKEASARPQTMREVVEELDRLGAPVARVAAKTPAPLPGTMMMFGGRRHSTPVVTPARVVTPVTKPAASPAPARFVTTAPPTPEVGVPPASPHTTLRSAASEHMIPVQPEEPQAGDGARGERERTSGGRGRRVARQIAGPVLAVLAGCTLAGAGYWALQGRNRAAVAEAPVLPGAGLGTEAGMAPAAVQAPLTPTPTPARPEPEPSPPPAASITTIAPALPEKPAETIRPMAEASAAAVPKSVKIAITSTPPDADVCLARNDLLIGHTGFDWRPERSPRVAKLWVRKPGYRGQEIAVSLDRDSETHVDLTELGPDDIADVESCHR